MVNQGKCWAMFKSMLQEQRVMTTMGETVNWIVDHNGHLMDETSHTTYKITLGDKGGFDTATSKRRQY